MIKDWKYALLVVLLCLAAVSCDDENESDDGNTPSVTQAEVTYLLYLVGQNDLSGQLNENIEALMDGYANTSINANVLVYADVNTTPTLYKLNKTGYGTVLKSVVKTYSDQLSVDPDVMQGVISFVCSAYPARRYGITFSSHADGSLYTPNTVRKRSFGYEGSNGYGMNITDIRSVLEQCPKMELVMFDACLMAGVETVYELKDCTHYFLGTPNSVPGYGFPYDKILPDLLKMDVDGLKAVAQGYMTYYRNNTETWDDFAAVSLTDAEKMPALAEAVNQMFLDQAVQRKAASFNPRDLQRFETGNYPLYDFGQYIDSIGKGSAHLAQVKEALDNAVLFTDHNDYASVNSYTAELEIPINDDSFCGLNTYVSTPSWIYNTERSEYFTTLQWYRDAGLWRMRETEELDATLLLYMVGQNDLAEFLEANIEDLTSGFRRTTLNANILVYADISTKPQLIQIEKDEYGRVTRKTVKTYKDQYSVDPEVMQTVINDVFATLYPAAHRGIIFSSHADGSLYTSSTVPQKRSFGYEGSQGYGMNITDMREALDECPTFDFIMFDACLMSGVETVYELKDRTHYVLAAPNTVPGAGFPYDVILPGLLQMDREGLTEAAQGYMDTYRNNNEKWDDYVAVCLTDATQMDRLAAVMKRICGEASVQEHAAAIDRDELQYFEPGGYPLYDFGQYADSLASGTDHAWQIRDVLSDAVVYKGHNGYLSANENFPYNLIVPVTDARFSGLNTYIPSADMDIYDLAFGWYFTTMRWYKDAGFSEIPFYNSHEQLNR